MAKRLGWYLPEQLILKITLLGSDPSIWRRVEVHSGLTLHDLHYVIQRVFDWDDSHMYQFFATEGGKLTRKARREAKIYHLLPVDPFFGEIEPATPADEAIVGQVLNQTRRQILYEYDFGDSWEHLVKLEKRTPGGDQDSVPVCLGGENAAPYDDMGGIYGYYHWVHALQDKRHSMHAEAVDWLGQDFDPTRFDLDAANERLRAAFKPVPKKPRKPRKKPE